MFICRRTGNAHNLFLLPHTSLFLLPLISHLLGDLGYILEISPRKTSPTSSSMSNGWCGRQGGNVVSPCRRTRNSLTFVPRAVLVQSMVLGWQDRDLLSSSALLLGRLSSLWFLVGRVKVWYGRSQVSHLTLTMTVSECIFLKLARGDGSLCQCSPRQHKKNPCEFVQKKDTIEYSILGGSVWLTRIYLSTLATCSGDPWQIFCTWRRKLWETLLT